MSDLTVLTDALTTHVVLAVCLLLIASFSIILLRASFIYIPNTHYGIVERRWSARRSRETFAPMALDGDAGFLPEVIRGGWHALTPFQYRVHKMPLIGVDQIACLLARVGSPLESGQALGEWPQDVDVEDAAGGCGGFGGCGGSGSGCLPRSGRQAPHIS